MRSKNAVASKKATDEHKTTFPKGRIGRLLRKGRYMSRVSKAASSYLTGVISYLTRELLEVAHNETKKSDRRQDNNDRKRTGNRVTATDLCQGVLRDEELGNLLRDVTFSRASRGVDIQITRELNRRKARLRRNGHSTSVSHYYYNRSKKKYMSPYNEHDEYEYIKGELVLSPSSGN